MFMHTWDVRELIMDMLETFTGNRVNYGMVTIGGARRDISDELRRDMGSPSSTRSAPSWTG